MDTSKEYIEMCRKAVEIQELWEPNGGDWVDTGCVLGDVLVGLDEKYKRKPRLRDRFIWLPRQDQLQDMVSLLCNFPCQILTFLNNWIKENKIYKSEIGSMEQLWLAFVMHEKYGKKWNGKEWE